MEIIWDHEDVLQEFSVVSELLQRILLDCLCKYTGTTDNQFGFKVKHGTDLCIYALKEIAVNRQTVYMSKYLVTGCVLFLTRYRPEALSL